MNPQILEVENLTTRFKTADRLVNAVNGISFGVGYGETLALVGESGSGKSVSMLSILKLLPPTTAEISATRIRFEGSDIREASESEMRTLRGSKVAMIFQDPMSSLNPVLTVGYQIMEPILVHGGMNRRDAQKRAEELLRLVGIPDAEQRFGDYPHRFSGGMRQRAAIAMALACNPMLLIADEPTTALDVTVQAQIIELVKRLRSQLHMAIIWITHDLGVVAGLADRVNVMYGGYIVESAPVDQIYDAPLHPYTQGLLGALPSLETDPETALRPVEGLPFGSAVPSVGCVFAPRCPYAKDRCRRENPALVERTLDHRVACWVNIATGELQ